MHIDRWLKQAGTQAARPLRGAVALGTGSGLLLLVQAWLLAGVVDAVVFRQQALSAVLPGLWALLGVFATRAVIAWLVEWISFRAAARIKVNMRRQLMDHVLALGPVQLIGERSGELANTITDGVEALEAYYSRYLPQMSLAVLVPLAILVVVFPLDWISGLVLLVTAPVIPLMMILIGKGAEALNQRQWRQLARLSAYFLDTLQGLTTLKLFNASRREAAVVARLSDDYRKSTMAVLRIAFLSSLALEFLATVSIALVAVLIGFRLLWGELGFQSGFLILLLAPEFYLPLRALGTHYHARMDAIGAAERMVELLETAPVPRAQGAAPLELAQPLNIQLNNVSFAYQADHPALDGVSFQLNHGDRVALVGPSGAGKTTVVNVLLGFVRPAAGEVLINGRALGELDPEDWLRHVAWVPQYPRLFHGTVLENIRLGNPGADADAVREAARLALADEFIEMLPRGYQTVVGEGGQGLSGGQVQRLALARAFLKAAPLVLLDEPSANLDMESERKLNTAVARLASGRTTITIAHRLNTVRQADRILVLEQGRLVETGSHQELLDHHGLYRQLVYSYGEVG
ncbi:MAG TPA: thiol reductant ABC exporter subunit CydD [Gammaproteobacteria bacterium]|nr:thiol reductant ABC exporter subunit CydD [Gammaproteobacteria bacterium]